MKPSDSITFAIESGMAIAWDETLQNAVKNPDFSFGQLTGAKAIVIKPSLVGNIDRCIHLIEEAQSLGLTAVVSSSLESSLGLTQLARFAKQFTPMTLPGLDTFSCSKSSFIPHGQAVNCLSLALLSKPWFGTSKVTRKSPLAVRKASSNLALVCNKGNFTWHQLAQHVGGIQLQLEEKGFVKGDVLLAITPHSSFELILVYLACIEQGVICALVPELTTLDLDKRIQTSGAKAVFLCPNTSLTLDGALEIDFALEQGLETQNYSEQNLTSLIFTSGSTGEPKLSPTACITI